MPGVLSQDEVDALLRAVEDGNVALGEVKHDGEGGGRCEVNEYSFRRPNLLTRDQLRVFSLLHDHFALDSQSRLSLLLRTAAEFRLVATDQLQYGEFIMSLPDVTHMLVLAVDTPPGHIIFEVGLPFIYSLVDVMLGGDGTTPLEHRSLTELESAITEPVLAALIAELQQCLNHVVGCKLSRQRAESSPQYVQAVSSDTPSLVLTFEAKIGGGGGTANICYPIPIVEQLLAGVHGGSNASTLFADRQAKESADSHLRDALQQVPVVLSAALGTANISVRQLLALQLGDIIVYDAQTTDLTPVLAGGVPMFLGRPGVRQGKLVVKLNRRLADTDGTAS